MEIQRIAYPDKSSDINSEEAIRKFYDQDANELKNVINNNADILETLEAAAQSPNPYYNRWTSLALLIAAHSTAEINAYAIIDAGAGQTPQIAAWDDVEQLWEIAGAIADKVYVNNFSALPAPGVENVFYITTDNYFTYIWKNNQYNLLNSQTTTTFNTIYVRGKSTTPVTSAAAIAVVFIYDIITTKITGAVFNANYSNYLTEIKLLLPNKSFQLSFYNETKKTTSIAKITAIDYTDGTNQFYNVTLEPIIDQSKFDVSDKIIVNISVYDELYKPTEIANTGALLSLSSEGGFICNMASPNANTKIKYQNEVLGGTGIVLINAASEPYVTNSVSTAAGSFVVGESYTIEVVGDTDFTAIGASANTVDVRFTATGIGAGTGEASLDATKIKGSDFIISTDMELYVRYNGVVVQYFFLEL
ncbi:hypothetical protein [Lacinutrix sp. Hel_I_90]|uniref:hypothetical protein n=1 Tax=Lacinutrix sp. Hel_I_90 TaxID=1249999 RepID=UPI0005CAE44E|nr:hypothetical protein [Lacinutrix sp. Hel_I_90]